jgi:membrane protein YqaA with SNARE-associated domain
MTQAPPQPPPIVREPHAPRVPAWHIHRRLYDWTAALANTPHATWLLAVVSFCEAIFFPIPPLVMQVPMSLERRDRVWFYAAVETVTSVLGGLVGYALGAVASGWLERAFPSLFSPEHIQHVRDWTDNAWIMTGGAIAVHPYKLYTIAMGILHANMLHFVLASIIGRGILFFGVAALLWWFGPPVRRFIDKYFNLLTVALGVLLIGIVVWAKLK